MKVFVVIPVYFMISSSIFKRPYFGGNPFVLDTVMVSSLSVIEDSNIELSTIISGVKLSNFKY